MKIDEIIVKDRIRKDTGGIMELVNDIKANGLINPVTVNTDHVLLAGYRRLTACKALGWTDIPAHMVSTESEEQELRIEISENEMRKEFSMTERLDYARNKSRLGNPYYDTRKQDLDDVMAYIQSWEPEVQFDGKAGTEAYKSYLDAMEEAS